ncbi:MAG: DUF6702 family protein [Bacteroidota bacterium]
MTAVFYKPLLYCYIFIGSLLPKPAENNALHPLHVSTSDISYNAQDSKLEVICTIFTDDFESAITKLYHTKTDLVKPDMHTAMDALVKKYIAANLHLKSGNVDAPLNYVGFEINREAVNVYLESDKIALPKKIDAEVTLLHNLYDDQINIVHITVKGVRKSGKLEFPAKGISQSF